MPIRTRLLHQDREYLVIEEALRPLEPAVSILAREDDEFFVPGRTCEPVLTDKGRWYRIASWDGEALKTGFESSEQQDQLRAMLASYLEQRTRRNESAPTAMFYLQVGGRPVFTLHLAQPGGLLISLYSRPEDADRALLRYAEGGRAISTGTLPEFLRLRAEEGFAGAMIDDEQPVYWCVDQDNALHFLRLREARDQEKLEGHLLDDSGKWQLYEGDEEIEFFEDQDQWDALMCELLGSVPYVGYDPGERYFTLRQADDLALVEDEIGDRTAQMVPVFLDTASAELFAEESELADAQIAVVEDLRALAREVAERGGFLRLHPAGHRSREGRIWMDADAIVLQSFSGFWRAEPGAPYERIG